jgi:hypothetical protein
LRGQIAGTLSAHLSCYIAATGGHHTPRGERHAHSTEIVMIEFAAGILIGGSVGAVIMGALLSQARALTLDVHHAATLQARAPMQVRRHTASPFTRRARANDSLRSLVPGHAMFAATSARLH